MKYYRKVINGLHSLLMALVSVALAIMIIVTALEGDLWTGFRNSFRGCDCDFFLAFHEGHYEARRL